MAEPDPLLVHHIRADPHARALDRLLELRRNSSIGLGRGSAPP